MLILAIYIGFGFLSILDISIFLFNKSLGGKKILKIDYFLKYFLIVIVFLFFILQPVSFIYANYNEADLSEPDDVYKFWDEAAGNMESNSSIYVLSHSANIGMFVTKYEYGEKQIKFIRHTYDEYTIANMKRDFEDGTEVYFVGNSGTFKSYFEFEQVGETYYWSRWYREVLKLFKIVGIKEFSEDSLIRENIKIDYNIDSYKEEFGEIFTLEYIIKNTGEDAAEVSSLELELPDSIEFVSVEPDGYIDQEPGISRGMYMWVSDDYRVDSGSEINIKINLRGTAPGKSVIRFRITTGGTYVSSEDVEVEIES